MTETSWTVFRLPRSHQHCQLDNFHWETVTPASLQGRIGDFVVHTIRQEAPHMLLTGKPGIGKSHIGVGVYRAGCAAFGTELSTWISVPAFCEAVKRSYGPAEVDPWRDIEGARRLVVLDDLFGRVLSMHEASQILYRLIDTVYQNSAALLVNMNQDVQELKTLLAGHEVSRLLASSTIIPMTAKKDYRLG